MRQAEEIVNLVKSRPELFDGINDKVVKNFVEWLPNNMYVFDAFERNAKYLKRVSKRKSYSISAIREKIRWDSAISDNTVHVKLANNQSSCIARCIMALNEELHGMFSTNNSRVHWDAWELGVAEEVDRDVVEVYLPTDGGRTNAE
jgi:hypothetical protein